MMEDSNAFAVNVDSPISCVDDDLLDRKNYSEGILRLLVNYSGKAKDQNESLVIGITGEWGSGKTSLVNMVVDELYSPVTVFGQVNSISERNEKAYSILNFYPWEFSLQRSLTEAFLYELYVHINGYDKDAGEKLLFYSKALGFGASAVSFVGGAMTLGGNPLGVALTAGSNLMKSASKMAKDGADLKKLISDKNLHEVKRDLIEALRQLKKPILVIIDDVDRLNEKEIQEVFHLVKCQGNLPNIVYLVLYDHDIVSESLDGITNDNGSRYLEKIVQITYQIPAIDEVFLRNYCLLEMSRCIEGSNPESFSSVWKHILSKYLKIIRNVKRYVASYGLNIPSFYEGGKLEVNEFHFAALECFRLYDPDVYSYLSKNKELIVSKRLSGETSEEEIFEKAKPLICGYVGGTGKKLNNRLYFDTYFQYAIKKTKPPYCLLEKLVSLYGNYEKTIAYYEDNLLDYDANEVAKYLRETDHHSLKKDDVDNFIKFLIWFCDQAPLSRVDKDNKALKYSRDYLSFIKNKQLTQGYVFEIRKLISIFEETNGLVLPVYFLRQETGEDSKSLNVCVLECIKSNKELLKKCGFPGDILRVLWILDDSDKTKVFLEECLEDIYDVVWLLDTCYSEREVAGETRFRISYDNLPDCFPHQKIQGIIVSNETDINGDAVLVKAYSQQFSDTKKDAK